MPVYVTGNTLPFRLTIPVPVRAPCPSKVCVTDTGERAGHRGRGRNESGVFVCEGALQGALEHPLSSAFAIGATARASAVTAAIAKAFAVVLRFMIISFGS